MLVWRSRPRLRGFWVSDHARSRAMSAIPAIKPLRGRPTRHFLKICCKQTGSSISALHRPCTELAPTLDGAWTELARSLGRPSPSPSAEGRSFGRSFAFSSDFGLANCQLLVAICCFFKDRLRSTPQGCPSIAHSPQRNNSELVHWRARRSSVLTDTSPQEI